MSVQTPQPAKNQAALLALNDRLFLVCTLDFFAICVFQAVKRIGKWLDVMSVFIVKMGGTSIHEGTKVVGTIKISLNATVFFLEHDT